jgi:hypothetical protein
MSEHSATEILEAMPASAFAACPRCGLRVVVSHNALLAHERACSPDSLDAAWAAAEASLPEGWWIDHLELSGMSVSFVDGSRDRLGWWEALAKGPKYVDAEGAGPTPAAALRALADRPRERTG